MVLVQCLHDPNNVRPYVLDRPGLPGSYEALIYEAGVCNFALDLSEGV